LTLQQEISNAADIATHKYTEVIPFKEKSNEGVANAIRVGAREKVAKLLSKMSKLLTMANPAHGPRFLEEVPFFITY